MKKKSKHYWNRKTEYETDQKGLEGEVKCCELSLKLFNDNLKHYEIMMNDLLNLKQKQNNLIIDLRKNEEMKLTKLNEKFNYEKNKCIENEQIEKKKQVYDIINNRINHLNNMEISEQKFVQETLTNNLKNLQENEKNQINQNYNIINNQLNQENNIQNIQIKTASNIYETQVKHLQEQEIKENDLENEMCQQDLKRINENSNNIKNSYQSRRNNLKNQIQAIQDEIFTLKNLEKTADPGGVEVITEKKSSCFGLKSKNSTHQIYRPNQKIAISQTISIRENTLRDLLKEQRILDNEEKKIV